MHTAVLDIQIVTKADVVPLELCMVYFASAF